MLDGLPYLLSAAAWKDIVELVEENHLPERKQLISEGDGSVEIFSH